MDIGKLSDKEKMRIIMNSYVSENKQIPKLTANEIRKIRNEFIENIFSGPNQKRNFSLKYFSLYLLPIVAIILTITFNIINNSNLNTQVSIMNNQLENQRFSEIQQNAPELSLDGSSIRYFTNDIGSNDLTIYLNDLSLETPEQSDSNFLVKILSEDSPMASVLGSRILNGGNPFLYDSSYDFFKITNISTKPCYIKSIEISFSREKVDEILERETSAEGITPVQLVLPIEQISNDKTVKHSSINGANHLITTPISLIDDIYSFSELYYLQQLSRYLILFIYNNSSYQDLNFPPLTCRIKYIDKEMNIFLDEYLITPVFNYDESSITWDIYVDFSTEKVSQEINLSNRIIEGSQVTISMNQIDNGENITKP